MRNRVSPGERPWRPECRARRGAGRRRRPRATLLRRQVRCAGHRSPASHRPRPQARRRPTVIRRALCRRGPARVRPTARRRAAQQPRGTPAATRSDLYRAGRPQSVLQRALQDRASHRIERSPRAPRSLPGLAPTDRPHVPRELLPPPVHVTSPSSSASVASQATNRESRYPRRRTSSIGRAADFCERWAGDDREA